MNAKKLLGVEENISPFVKWGGLSSFLILYMFLFQNFTQHVDDTELNLAAVNNQRAALLSIENAPNVTENIVRINNQIEQIESGFLQEETVGLNNAFFQTLLVQLLNKCELQRLRISTRTEPDSQKVQSGAIIATIQAQDPKRKIMACFSELRTHKKNLEVTRLNWRQRGNIEFDVKAHYLAPKK